MFRRILVPTDGSDAATTAEAQAIAMARRFDADLHAIHVREAGELPPGVEDEGATEAARLWREALATLAERADSAGVDVTTRVVEHGGPTHKGIVADAREHDADCIVMGTHGRTGVDRFVLGSVAERTLREAQVPVLTVHPDTPVGAAFESVLVPTDGSDSARAAGTTAVDLARATDATLRVLSVVDLGAVWGDDAGTILDAVEKGARRAVDEVADEAEAAGVPVETAVLTGSPVRAILEHADDEGVDCIVVGTHGRTGLDRVLLGSVAERVVRLADVPVLGVKANESDGE